jgi:hypothetical protein
MSTRQKKGTRTKKTPAKSAHGRMKQGQKRQQGGPQRSIQTVGAAIGGMYPQAYIRRGGVAQQTTDQDPAGSERISGCDLFSYPLGTGTSSTSGFGVYPGSSGTYWVGVTPSIISSRLAAIEEMFQWYAIRKLKIHYTSVVGTSTSGSIAIGISTDAQIASAFTTPTQQQIMELQPALLCPVWSSASMELEFRGTKLYESYASGEAKDEKVQASIGAAFNAFLTNSTTYGQLWVEYVIDFYQQVPLLSSVDLIRSGRPCPRCHQQVVVSETKDKLPLSLERKVKSLFADRESDDYIVLRAQEPPSVELRPLPASATRGTAIYRDEGKSPISSKRAQSLKG